MFNWVNVTKRTQVRGTRDTDEWTLSIDAGDSRQKPECVTQWLSDSLFVDLSIIVEDHDIDSVDIESEEVTVL